VESPQPAPARPPRAARSGAVALAAVGTSVGGHALAGGSVPSPAALAGFTLAVAALTTWLARLRWTPARLLAALGVAQGGFHLGFEHLAPGTGLSTDLRMVAWHAVAGVVACVLVLRAERWWWRVFAGPACDLSPAAAPVEAAVSATGWTPPPSGRARDPAVPRRGPPLSAAA
jgi:hypothetical protein